MEATKGRYLRPEHDPDDDLRAIGVNITDLTREVPLDAPVELENGPGLLDAPVELENGPGLLEGLKYPVLFLGLVIGIGVCEYLGLMAEVIAVPGMCVCAACFGWNARWR